ncbi:MAG: DUF4427 domain-containing protein [Candidatus Methylumidiphilus sp.]
MFSNSVRFDLSDWLIHFFRDIDLESTNSIIFPEHMGWENIAEDTKYSSLFMLRCAVRSGRLWATWSYRNNRRTIYGSSPVVCFTEMPLAAFLESSEYRYMRGETMSQFALVFQKKDLYKINANPVIYGLDDRQYQPPAGKNGEARIIDARILQENEQYRYVTYNPASNKPIDWSHEREWRWPYRGSYSSVENYLEEYGVLEDILSLPGLDFYTYDTHDMGVVVKNEKQASWIIHDILSLVDRNIIGDTQYKFILVADRLPPAPQLINPEAISDAISKSIIDLEPFFLYDQCALKHLSEELSRFVTQIENESPPPENGEYGGCWLWILDNTSKFLRTLLHSDRIVVSDSGKYLVNLYEFSDSRSLRQREEMTRKLANLLSSRYEIECGYFSVLNSDNPNALPFYNDNHIDNHMYYNVSWEY